MMWLMSGAFSRLYSDRQRLAVALAFDPPRVSAATVSERAAAGRLLDIDGKALSSFTIPPASVRTISARTRRSGVGEDEGVDAAGLGRLYARLSSRAARLVAGARTADEISKAARVMSEVEQLRSRLQKSPAPSAQSTLAQAIADAARGSSSAPPPALVEPASAHGVSKSPPPEPAPAVEEEGPAPEVEDHFTATMRAVAVEQGLSEEEIVSRAEWMRGLFGPLLEQAQADERAVALEAAEQRAAALPSDYHEFAASTREGAIAAGRPWVHDKPLPSAEVHRRDRRVKGGPDYSPDAYESGRRW
jgi:hypothetical protein